MPSQYFTHFDLQARHKRRLYVRACVIKVRFQSSVFALDSKVPTTATVNSIVTQVVVLIPFSRVHIPVHSINASNRTLCFFLA